MTSHSGSELANALHALDVDFVVSEKDITGPLKNEPLQLIVGLAENEESRLRLSLIPLFLRHPGFSKYCLDAAKTISPKSRLTLQCYYTAAMWLQQKYHGRLLTVLGERPELPDLFSKELNIVVQQNPEENLRTLALKHQELSGRSINWLGTYEHGAQRFLTHLERQKQWQT